MSSFGKTDSQICGVIFQLLFDQFQLTPQYRIRLCLYDGLHNYISVLEQKGNRFANS